MNIDRVEGACKRKRSESCRRSAEGNVKDHAGGPVERRGAVLYLCCQ